jgi:hypothetical protein
MLATVSLQSGQFLIPVSVRCSRRGAGDRGRQHAGVILHALRVRPPGGKFLHPGAGSRNILALQVIPEPQQVIKELLA